MLINPGSRILGTLFKIFCSVFVPRHIMTSWGRVKRNWRLSASLRTNWALNLWRAAYWSKPLVRDQLDWCLPLSNLEISHNKYIFFKKKKYFTVHLLAYHFIRNTMFKCSGIQAVSWGIYTVLDWYYVPQCGLQKHSPCRNTTTLCRVCLWINTDPVSLQRNIL